eukprot:3602184-Rhodomonas_salina.4
MQRLQGAAWLGLGARPASECKSQTVLNKSLVRVWGGGSQRAGSEELRSLGDSGVKHQSYGWGGGTPARTLHGLQVIAMMMDADVEPMSCLGEMSLPDVAARELYDPRTMEGS